MDQAIILIMQVIINQLLDAVNKKTSAWHMYKIYQRPAQSFIIT